jgi:hypothetical protein
MNEATASGVLDGDAVVADPPPAGAGQAGCAFSAPHADAGRTLLITVETAAEAPHQRLRALMRQCASKPDLLDAIGNEAFVCRARPGRDRRGAFAAGRVRDQIFTIVLSSGLRSDPALTPRMLRMHIAVAAEQVAGNLF